MDQPRWIPQLYGYVRRAVRSRWSRRSYVALRSLVTSTLMLLVALLLFGVHWRWLRGTRNAMT